MHWVVLFSDNHKWTADIFCCLTLYRSANEINSVDMNPGNIIGSGLHEIRLNYPGKYTTLNHGSHYAD